MRSVEGCLCLHRVLKIFWVTLLFFNFSSERATTNTFDIILILDMHMYIHFHLYFLLGIQNWDAPNLQTYVQTYNQIIEIEDHINIFRFFNFPLLLLYQNNNAF